MYQKICTIISKLSSRLKVFFNQDRKLDVSVDSIKVLITAFITSFKDLHLVFKDLSKVVNVKIALEYQLPTTTKAPQLKTSNEFMLSSLLSLSSAAAKLSGFLQENEDFFLQIYSDSQLSDPCASNLHRNAVSYMTEINQFSAPPSIPYFEALKSKDSVANDDRKELLAQIEKATQRIQTLEQEKEHWLLETQLLQMKVNKLKTEKKTQNIEYITVVKNDENPIKKPRSTSNAPTDASGLGNVVENHANENDVQETTEDLIKQHMSARLAELANKLQFAEAKAIHFESECKSLQNHLVLAQKNSKTTEDGLSSTTQKVSQLHDELAVTRRSYEEQLSLMSEHLAAMNDKLATQKDEIESLKVNKRKSKIPGLR